ncbi:MAG: sugar phosphate isomerase/epimerase [Candidatus Atribacteria bacterium]|nr:sugar phosphate isomerase/epimerase [Candidatus Atribacteria bacterium]
MKKGINQWAFPGNYPIPDLITEAAMHGFDGVELCPDEEGVFPLSLGSEVLQEIKGMAGDKNIAIRSIALGVLWKYNLASPNESIRKKALEVGKRGVEMADALGASSVLIIPGYVSVPWDPASEVVPYEEAMKLAKQSITELAIFARGTRVALGLENVWNKLFLSPVEFRSFVDEIGEPSVKIHFDTANVLISGYPEQWIDILGERIVTVHAKDFKLSVGNINGFCIPLEGDVNFPAVMQSLHHAGYDDYLIAEVIPPYHHSLHALLANISYNLDCIMSMGV